MSAAVELHRRQGITTGPESALVSAFLSGHTGNTLRAYAGDLQHFREFLGVRDLDSAAVKLLGGTHGEANALALAYRTHLVEKGLAPTTVNRRLAAVRSLVKLGRTLGLVSWSLEISNVKSQAYRDTRGPGLEGFRRLPGSVKGDTVKASRDRAILRHLFDLALRRVEVCRLDLEDLDVGAGQLAVQGKGRTEKELRTL